MRRTTILLLSVAILALLLLACTGTGGDGDTATPTPVPPAGRSGMQAINGIKAEGVQPDCSRYPVWLECSPTRSVQGQP